MSQRGLTIVVLVTAVALVVGCGGGSSGPSTPQAVRPVQPAASSGAVVPAQGRLLGDLDNDGNPTVGDAIKILRIVVALDPDDPCADANQNGSADVGDAIKVLRCVVSLDTWPIGECLGGPSPDLTGGPTGDTTDTTPTFSWADTSGRTVVGYEYRLDGGAWTEVDGSVTEVTLGPLAAGPHTFEVRAKYDDDTYSAIRTVTFNVQAPSEPYESVLKWGSEGSGNGQFDHPSGLILDGDSNVYVVDVDNDRIQKFTSAGDFLTTWGSEGLSADGEFNAPLGIAVDTASNVYVADLGNHRIQKFSSAGTFLSKWGSPGGGDGQFNYPYALAVAAGNVYVADCWNHRIQKFTSTGTFLAKWGSYGSGAGQFIEPVGVAVDTAGNVYVTDYGNHRIQKFSSDGTFLAKWGSQGSADGQIGGPHGLAVDAAGNVYVAEQTHHRIQKFRPVIP